MFTYLFYFNSPNYLVNPVLMNLPGKEILKYRLFPIWRVFRTTSVLALATPPHQNDAGETLKTNLMASFSVAF